MIQWIQQHKVVLLKGFVIISLIIPIVSIGYEVLFLDKDSVVVFDNTPLPIALTIIGYYILLLVLSIAWLVMQLKSLIDIKNEQKKNELLHLKSQVNPHFFFNTLNNLYGLVKKDTDKAQQLILTLSDMMRYSIYEGEKKLVSLADEITFIENYIHIHTSRYHKKTQISFQKNIDQPDYKIVPLLFINLVENAFKHGVENLCEDAFINIQITAQEQQLTFVIENNVDPSYMSETEGIGLKNLKRRLELIYPNNHKFSQQKKDTLFTATLNINL
ncbi:sensor histidine kinase [Tenacibaculum amylolyticum]|uniref:sensor histidine kinase n=1 Tax=Tenacibaculum amylolyticum TaxID=104269 RepID=UPI003895E650